MSGADHIEGKRRRRRRRKRSSPPDAAPLVDPVFPDLSDEDSGPIAPAKIKGGKVSVELPVRFLEMLNWLASSRRQSLDQAVASIVRSHLTALKPQYREATQGTLGGSARKGAEFDRLTERMRPGGAS